MQYHKQLLKHDPGIGVFGDCFRTALACLMNKSPEHVPHFLHDDPCVDEFWKRVNTWLEIRDLFLVNIPFDGASIEGVLLTMGTQNPHLCYLLQGQGNNQAGHVVIACDDAIIHDPAGEYDNPLIGPCEEDGFYWVSFLVPSFCVNENRDGE